MCKLFCANAQKKKSFQSRPLRKSGKKPKKNCLNSMNWYRLGIIQKKPGLLKFKCNDLFHIHIEKVRRNNMNRIKKLIALSLVALLSVGLYACGSSGAAPAASGTSAASTAAASTAAASTAAASTAAKSEAAPAAPAASAASLKCFTPAAEGSGYKYDNITVGIGMWGRFLAGLSPTECDAACSLVFDVIFKTDPITKEIKSDILEDWYMEDDTTLIMKMKDGVYFSNGDKATAEDLLFAYSNHVERGSNYMDNLKIDFDNCEIVDELTLKMKFEKFYSSFYNNTTIYLLDKSWSEEVGWDSMDWYAPVGSGPYACTEYAQEDHMTFVARDDYWNNEDPIVVKQWTLKYYSDSKTMTLALENGDIAMCRVYDSDYSSYVQNNGADNPVGYVMEPFHAGVITRLMFSFIDTDVFYDKNVRAAFAYGINWDELGEIVSGELYEPARSYVSVDSPEFVDVGRYEYDLDKAIGLLKEAGYDESNPLVLSTFQMDTPWYKDICEAFQFYASQMGVQVNLEFGDVSAALTEWFKDTGTDFGFLYNNLGSLGGQLNQSMDAASNPTAVSFAYIDDPKFLELYDGAAYSPDPEEALKLSQECQQYMHDEYLSIPIAESMFVIGYNTNVLTSEMIPFGCMNAEYYNLANWSHASIWK